jgi:glycosyltransferase involved in cell wall biosynthesis
LVCVKEGTVSEAAIHVALISGSLPPVQCGVGEYTCQLGRHLLSAGIRVTLICGSSTERVGQSSTALGVECSEPVSNWRARSFRSMAAAVSEIAPDILHVQYPSQGYDGCLPSLIATWFRLKRRRPVIATLHEHIPPHYLRTMLLPLAASAIVSVRPNFHDRCRHAYSWGALAKRFEYIPNASTIPCAQLTDNERLSIRRELKVPDGKRLIVYFGLIYERRGVHQLFEIADPGSDYLLIVGGSPEFGKSYFEHVRALSQDSGWRDCVRFTGFVPEFHAARLLATADAVVLPFLDGGGVWNTSIHAARTQGSLVITTSNSSSGFDEESNTFEAAPSDIRAMRGAIDQFAGRRVPFCDVKVPRWSDIADQHILLYRKLLQRSN